MINPNVSKRVIVNIQQPVSRLDVNPRLLYGNLSLSVVLRDRDLKPGKRALYLKYSIMFDSYYLSDRK